MPNSPKTLQLSPVDYPFCEKSNYSITFVMRFSERQDFAAMRASLPAALDKYYPLRGRLTIDGRNEYAIVDDVSGPLGAVSFERREARGPESDDALSLLDYAAPVDGAVGSPVAKFELIDTPHGSLLSASTAHGVGDGFSHFFFLVSWAAMTRGLPVPDPAHKRELLVWQGDDYGDLSDPAVAAATGYTLLDEHRPPAPLGGYARLTWTTAELADLRADAERATERKISDNDLISASVLKDCAKRWHKPGDRLRMHCPRDFRRIVPEVTPLFFGNGTRGVPFEATYDDIVRSSLSSLAARVSAAVESIGRPQVDDHVRVLQGLKVRGGLETTRRVYSWHPDSGLLMTNLTRMPLQQIDFGRGHPQQVCPIGTPRAYIVLSRPGAIEALVGLPG